ncbi:hypothetical protein FSY75_09210 [Streptomyces sp. TR1341]|uniref:glycine-rich domain-containing protein n=1 Tax=Streptomyces sp. TR1341 TaxID=2601266 RepID=UPI00138B0F49|nr:hypothetical protein [Streptomyces sp. TR1341]
MSGKCWPTAARGAAGPPGPPGPPGEAACVSTDPGNALATGTDGCLSVPVDPTGPIRPGDDGLTLCLSDTADNTAQLDDDGCLYVPPGSGEQGPEGPEGPAGPPGPEGPAAELCVSAGSETVLAVDGDGCLGLVVDPTGPVRPGDNGLTLCLSDDPEQTATLDDDGCLLVTGGAAAALPVVTMTTAVEVHTEDGEFDPAAYPGLQYVRARVQGAGGGSTGAGSNPSAPYVAVGAAGGGGAYSESLINAADLTGPVPITVGVGGAGSAVNVQASNGGDSSFGTLVLARGGRGGTLLSTTLPEAWTESYVKGPTSGGFSNGAGQLQISGGAPTPSIGLGGTALDGLRMSVSGNGGGSHLGGQVPGGYSAASNDGTQGSGGAGRPYGSGAAAPVSQAGNVNPGPANPGFKGGDGVVIVEIYQLTVTAP